MGDVADPEIHMQVACIVVKPFELPTTDVLVPCVSGNTTNVTQVRHFITALISRDSF